LEWRRSNASNLSPVEAEQTVKEIINGMNWWKKKSKEYDVIEESLETDICKLCTAWRGKKNRKSKVVAHEIEEALDWWSRNDYELDEEASPAEEETRHRFRTTCKPTNERTSKRTVEAIKSRKSIDIQVSFGPSAERSLEANSTRR
jgi:hypothetical protein